MKILTARFDDALVYASRLHANQLRKGTRVPYASHLLAVTAIVLEQGGDEDEAIAALLHDAVEDQGGRPVLQEIERRFGSRVAGIVDGCTDAYTLPKPPWRERKEAYLSQLQGESASVRLVSAADKLHNLRSILADYRLLGDGLWQRFNGGRDGTLWYHRQLCDAFQGLGPQPLAAELQRTLVELESLVGDYSP